MNQDFLGTAKRDGALVLKMVNLVAKISKIKLDMARMRKDREKHLRSIGLALHEVYTDGQQTLDGNLMMEKVSADLDRLQRIEVDLKNGDDEIARLRNDFRQSNPGAKMPPEAENDDHADSESAKGQK